MHTAVFIGGRSAAVEPDQLPSSHFSALRLLPRAYGVTAPLTVPLNAAKIRGLALIRLLSCYLLHLDVV